MRANVSRFYRTKGSRTNTQRQRRPANAGIADLLDKRLREMQSGGRGRDGAILGRVHRLVSLRCIRGWRADVGGQRQLPIAFHRRRRVDAVESYEPVSAWSPVHDLDALAGTEHQLVARAHAFARTCHRDPHPWLFRGMHEQNLSGSAAAAFRKKRAAMTRVLFAT